MSLFARIAYRSRQAWNVLTGLKQGIPNEHLPSFLVDRQLALFQQMTSSEKAHAFRIYKRLIDDGHRDQDLLTAALLHDVGKIRSPLNLFDRALIVVCRRLFPHSFNRWGEGEARGLLRPFVVAAQHPAWGAKMAEKAGATPETCALIQFHQENKSIDHPLLAFLQAVDNES